MYRSTFPVLVLVSATGVGGACGGSDSDSAPTKFEQACEAYCDKASSTPGCGQALSNCSAACFYLEEAYGGACNGPYADLFACSAASEFTCQNDFPVPNAAQCLNEATAALECIETAPCIAFCDAAGKAGCGGDACLASCKADTKAFSLCTGEVHDLLDCETMSGVVCKAGAPTAAPSCQTQLTELESCLGTFSPCGAVCLDEEIAGCLGTGSDVCVTDCETKQTGATCGSEYEQLIDCEANNGLTCSSGKPTSTAACATQQQAYDACAML